VSTACEPAIYGLRNASPTNREDHSDILAVLLSGLVVADVSVVHPAATSSSRAATWNAGAAAASRDALKRCQYHAGGLPAALSFSPLTVESYSHIGAAAMRFLNALAEVALASSATGTDVTKVAFISGALRKLGVTFCVWNELVYREGLNVYAVAGGTCMHMGMCVCAEVT
jgi:hypothetical protein